MDMGGLITIVIKQGMGVIEVLQVYMIKLIRSNYLDEGLNNCFFYDKNYKNISKFIYIL